MSERNDDELEELREERLEELQERAGEEGDGVEAQQQAQQQAEAQKKAMLRQHLTDGARKRLNSVRMTKPDFAEQVEQQVLALAQSGRVDGRINEDQMREILSELSTSKDYNIRRR